MKIKPKAFTLLVLVWGWTLVCGGCAATQESESNSRNNGVDTRQASKGNSQRLKPGKLQVSKEAGGYILTLEGVDRKHFAKVELSKAAPPKAFIMLAGQAERLPVRLSEPKYNPGPREITYKLEFLQASTQLTLPIDGGSVHVLGGLPR